MWKKEYLMVDCLSPSLYTVFTANLPEPIRQNTTYFQYAGDILQVIASLYKNPTITVRITEDEIRNYKQLWEKMENYN